MGRRSQHSIRKRQRELKKREKAEAKRLKKAERKAGPEGEFASDLEEEGAEAPVDLFDYTGRLMTVVDEPEQVDDEWRAYVLRNY